ncbi:methyl-accepting chemotaxis protein [Ferrovibrio sp.]|uniref:methyl-accepting chemotaxis protein n=1 Tax=Ferrovibrio sp. TaxID=1917215 RepID=UPI003D0ACDDE
MLRFLNNTKILTRIAALLILMSFATIGVGVMARYIIDVSDQVTDDMANAATRALYSDNVFALSQTAIADSRGLYMATTPEETERYAKAIEATLSEMDIKLNAWGKIQPADEKANFAETRRMVDAFAASRHEISRIARTEGALAARTYQTRPEVGAVRDAAVTNLRNTATTLNKAVNDLNDNVTVLYRQQRVMLLIAVAAAVTIGLLIGGFTAIGTIIRPIRAMTGTMTTLAGGDTTVAVDGAQRKDEIGAMARAVQVFKDNMIAREKAEADIAEQRRVTEAQRTEREARERKAIEEISQLCDKASAGDLGTRLNETGKEGFLLTISQQLNGLTGMLQQVTGEIATVAGGMAQGDLSNDIRGNYQGVFGQLKIDMNRMAVKLRQIAGDLGSSAANVNDAAAEISSGSQDLAQRTEAQAAAIEQTAASMHEITTTVKQNADNAQAANQLAETAHGAAENGGKVMRDVVSAMGEIETSATRITDIVGLIDEIAFQTNLLALNASVEAARAGEAGKGFAVVAQEVRALAQRSANASKDIKALINQSNAQVREGGKLVGEAGRSLEDIVKAVQKVSTIVAEIAAASREQALGLEQINTAVGSMDEMTQRNGALVEETSASAQALSNQASDLAKLVSFFKVGRPQTLARAA